MPISEAHCTGERSPLPLRERVRVRGHSPDWHGSAMQDTRTPSSMGFRRRCAAWRVTLERPKVTKSLLPHLFALLRRVPSVQAKGLAERRRRYIPVPPASAPSSMTALLTLCPRLGEQQGATPNPQPRGQLADPYVFGK